MDPSYCLIGEPSTVNDWMDIHGRVGISFESGQLTDVSKVKETYESILNILRHHGLVEESPSRDPYYSMDNWDFYEKKSSVVMTGAGWEFASGRGERNFEPFHKDEVLGYHGSEPFRAPHDGYIMFPKIKNYKHQGNLSYF